VVRPSIIVGGTIDKCGRTWWAEDVLKIVSDGSEIVTKTVELVRFEGPGNSGLTTCSAPTTPSSEMLSSFPSGHQASDQTCKSVIKVVMSNTLLACHTDMNPYVLLGAAILSEIIGTTSLKLSEGFSQPLPSLVVVLGYGAAFYLLSLTLEELPVGVVYGTWAALGIVGVAAIGIVVFDEQIDVAGVIGISLIIAGVYCLNVLSGMSTH